MKAFASVLFVALVCLASPAPLFAQVDPTKLYVQSVSYSGTGCPQDTANASFSNDRTTFTLMFDAFVASKGPDIPATESDKSCQVNVTLHVPQGSSAGCFATTYRGYAQMESDFLMRSAANFDFDGATERSGVTIIPGPVAQDYINHSYTIVSYRSERETTSLTMVQPFLRVEGPPQPAQMTVDSIDGKIGECEFINSNGDPAPPFDATPAVITTTRSVQPNVNGWNNTDVTFSYACTDEDGISTVHLPTSALEPDTLSESGRAHAACHGGRNISLSYHFADIDTVAPTVTTTGVVAGGMYGLNSVVSAASSCSDGNSGIDSCTAPSAVDTSTLGPHLFTVSAVDKAGNVGAMSLPYSVGGKDECKGGGHGKFLVPAFKNQGQCVSTYAGKK